MAKTGNPVVVQGVGGHDGETLRGFIRRGEQVGAIGDTLLRGFSKHLVEKCATEPLVE